MDEAATDDLIRFLLAGKYALGDAAFERRNGGGERDGLLSQEWEEAIVKKFNGMLPESRLHGYQRPLGIVIDDIRIWTLPELQRICRLNANAAGNMVDEVAGVELSPDNWGVDRVINEIVPGASGEYRNTHCIITHNVSTI